MMKDFVSFSPLKILEGTAQKALGRGNLGVLIAHAGVGKTTCLIHIAFDKLFREEKLVHISLDTMPEKITSYYNVIFLDLVANLKLPDEHEIRAFLERNRMILAYLNQSFEIGRLRENLKNLEDKVGFSPSTLIVDGLDFEKSDRAIFEGFKDIATQCDLEVWFSALSHRHLPDLNERGIPYPCSQFDDLFDIIIQLQHTESGIYLTLLKNQESEPKPDIHLNLDPETFLALTP
jgi:hypothetical protein